MPETIFDVAIIGAGVVGAALARELSRHDLRIALVDGNADVGMGTSKASTAIWHTGFDAKPGSLESKAESPKQLEQYLRGTGEHQRSVDVYRKLLAPPETPPHDDEEDVDGK